MTCDEAHNLINAALDGELPNDLRPSLDAHLATCAGCRTFADAAVLQHEHLRRAAASRRTAADRIAASVIAQLPGRVERVTPKVRRRVPWLPMALSAAAGFAVAFIVLRARGPVTTPLPPQVVTTQPTAPATQRAIAHLSLATGPVTFRLPGQSEWSAMPTGGAVPAGTEIRTGPDVRCELVTNDGSEIRLNANTEVAIRTPRRFELASGQAWSTVSHAGAERPFEAFASNVTVTALGTQFDLALAEKQLTCTVADGAVKVTAAADVRTVRAGQRVAIADGHLGETQTAHDLAVATRWVNEILVMKGRDNPELTRRVDDLFAQIGEQKMSFMYEDEIRALGDHAVIPLVRYLESDRSQGDKGKRAIAAKIVADVAPPWAIPELIGLLGDEDGEVRYEAAAALHRLTGRNVGRTPEQFRNDSPFACTENAKTWRTWWEENRARFPGASPVRGMKEPAVAKEREPAKKG